MNPNEQTELPTEGDAPRTAIDNAKQPDGLIVRGLRKCLGLAAVLLLIQFLFTLVARFGDTIELASHFSMHALVASCPVVLGALILRSRASLWMGLTVLLGHLIIVQPWSLYLATPTSLTTKYERSLTVLSWNVLSSNYQFEAVDEVIRNADADLLILIEVRPGFLDDLSAIEELGYQRRLVRPSWRGGGIAVFARDSSIELEAMDFGYETYPVIVAKIPRESGLRSEAVPALSSDDLEAPTESGSKPSGPESPAENPAESFAENHEQPVYLIAQHTFSPMPISRTPHRDNQLLASVQFALEHSSAPTLLVGDLNVTPWAPVFGELLDAGFEDSRVGKGNCPSWPAGAGPVGIPIDHVLHRGKCAVSQRVVLPTAPGSDHRPVSFTLHY